MTKKTKSVRLDASSSTSADVVDKNLPARLADANNNIVAKDIQKEIEALKTREDRMLAMEARMKETADKADTVVKLNLRGREYHVLKETLLKYEKSYFFGLVSSGTWMPDHNGKILIPFSYFWY